MSTQGSVVKHTTSLKAFDDDTAPAIINTISTQKKTCKLHDIVANAQRKLVPATKYVTSTQGNVVKHTTSFKAFDDNAAPATIHATSTQKKNI